MILGIWTLGINGLHQQTIYKSLKDDQEIGHNGTKGDTMLRGLRTSSVTDLVSEVMIISVSAHVENSSRQQIVTCRYYKKIEDVKFYSKLTTIG